MTRVTDGEVGRLKDSELALTVSGLTAGEGAGLLSATDDTLLWADNHHTLHGRAIYTDPERHLIRIRISNTPNARRIGPSGISAD